MAILILLITQGITGKANGVMRRHETTGKREFSTIAPLIQGNFLPGFLNTNGNQTVSPPPMGSEKNKNDNTVNYFAFAIKQQLPSGIRKNQSNYPGDSVNPPSKAAKPKGLFSLSPADNVPLQRGNTFADNKVIRKKRTFNHSASFYHTNNKKPRKKKTAKNTAATPMPLAKKAIHKKFTIPLRLSRKKTWQQRHHTHRARNKAKKASAELTTPSLITRAFGVVTNAAINTVKLRDETNDRAFPRQNTPPKHTPRLATKSALQHNLLLDNNVYPAAYGKNRYFYCPTKNAPCYRLDESGKRIYYTCTHGYYCDKVKNSG